MIEILDDTTLDEAAMMPIEAFIMAPSIDIAEFYPRTSEMTIHFANGRALCFPETPRDLFEEFVNSDFPATFYVNHLEGRGY